MPALKRNKSLEHFVLIAAFSIVAMLPAYYYGVPSGNDQSQHFQFAETVYRSIVSGELYPHLAGETNHGFGDVGLRFYPPLTYYVLSSAYIATGDWYFACLVVFTGVFFLGGIGVYFWTRELFDPPTALIAAAIYTFAPYHVNLLYNNCLLAEFTATAVLPFCFLFLTRVCTEQRWSNVLWLAVSYALLILTHLPMTIIGSLALGIYALFLLDRKMLAATFTRLGAAIALAVTATAFYWVRMLPELAWVKHSSPKYFSDTWAYGTNFLLLPSHFTGLSDDVLNLWLADVMLIAVLLVAAPTLIYLLKGRLKNSRGLSAVSVTFACAVFMTVPLSSFVWANLPFLQKVQFPWRWLSVVTAFGAVFASVGIRQASDAVNAGKSASVTVGLGLILTLFVFAGVFLVRGPVYLDRAAINAMFGDLHATTGCECWWPIWAQVPAISQTERVVLPDRTSEAAEWTNTSVRFAVNEGRPATAVVAKFYYPHWHGILNGREIAVGQDENGAISIQVPAERSDIHLVFREPQYVRTTAVISALCWLFMVAWALRLFIACKKLKWSAAE